MPTEADFLSAASLFDDAGDDVAGVPGLVADAFGPDVATGGQLAAEIDALISQTAAACNVDASELRDLARLCRDRAAIAAAFDAAMASYQRSMNTYTWAFDRWLGDLSAHEQNPDSNPHPGRRPQPPHRPRRPAEWVET
ncbi:MAG: hypothetical protein ACN4GZ_10485 [Acidimicrobiales bacterium]